MVQLSALVTSLLLAASSAAALRVPASRAHSAPDVDVSIQWPESNPFGRITNGHSSNLLHVRLNNHAGEEIVVTRVYGAFREPHGRERALRNTTTLALQQPILPGLKSPLIPYKFHSENKQGEVGLRVWVDYLDASKRPHTVLGFEGTATVSEPKGSWFDPALLFSYAVVAALLYGLFSLVYSSYAAPAASSSSSKGKRAPRPTSASSSATSAKPAAAGVTEGATIDGVDEEWIPAHLRKRAPKAKMGGGGEGATSGEESEVSAGGKGKKGKRGGRK